MEIAVEELSLIDGRWDLQMLIYFCFMCVSILPTRVYVHIYVHMVEA